MTVVVTDNPSESRFEARIDGTLAGVAEYRRTADLVEFTHTEVDPRCEGMGVGSALARYALDQVRAEGIAVLASCPFIRGWLRRHPGYLGPAQRGSAKPE